MKDKNKGRFICAWCGKDLGPSQTPENSHGVCVDCKRERLTPKRQA